MAMNLEGGCLCGGLRYRLTEEPKKVNDCHCIDCRRASGAPFVRWGIVHRDRIEILSGNLRKVPYANRLRSFASCCGTPVFFQDKEGDELIDVAIATLDDPSPFRPRVAIWAEDRMPWVPVDPSIPSFEKTGRPPVD